MINKWNDLFLSNYSTPDIELVQGEGVYVKDSKGNIYLDFLAGIAVNTLGHAHPKVIEAVNHQIKTLSHTSNLYANNVIIRLAEEIISIAGFKGKLFFCNSGTEALEAAMKLSRLMNKTNVVALDGSFHGRTFGSLSITGQIKKQKPFTPLVKKVKFIEPNNQRALKRSIKTKTAAFFLEPIQGEGGVIDIEKDFVLSARNFTRAKKCLFVIDEVQTGIGRTGNWFAFQNLEVVPDVLCMAKGLAGGLPIGAILVHEDYQDLFQPGHHGSTFGGNPIVASAALAVIKTIREQKLLENVINMGTNLREQILQISDVEKVTGSGLLLGIKLKNISAKSIEKECQKLGMLVNAVSENVIRIAPPLIISEEHVNRAVEILDDAINIVKRFGENIEIR